MTVPNVPEDLEMSGLVSEESEIRATRPIEEQLQKRLDKFLYGGGRPAAQKTRDFLNGTWLGEPLHVVVKDAPIGAWTMAMVFDLLGSIINLRKFALAADIS